MGHSQPEQKKNGLNRRDFLKIAGATGAGLVLAPTLLGAQKKGAAPTGGEEGFYQFVNKTNGKWKDEQIFWSKDGGKSWKSLAESPTAPNGGNGRMYFYIDKKPANFDDWSTYWDFIEYNSGGRRWAGNTTQVDAWCLPLTIELGSHKVGITGPRTKLFEKFKKECPPAFKNCVVGDNVWLLSPFKADLGTGKPFEKYFEKYVDEVWEMYAKETKTPSGKFIGKADSKGALVFTPVDGGKAITCESKPSTKDILLGERVLGRNAGFCGAFNRHVAEDPADWKNPSKYYLKEPCNWYSKFLHEVSIDHKSYGFCYDDASEQAAYFAGEADHLIVTFNWD
jgi:hypothetical protein